MINIQGHYDFKKEVEENMKAYEDRLIYLKNNINCYCQFHKQIKLKCFNCLKINDVENALCAEKYQLQETNRKIEIILRKESLKEIKKINSVMLTTKQPAKKKDNKI